MLAIISPSKTQDYEDDLTCSHSSSLLFPKETQELAVALGALSETGLAKKLEVSAKLAKLNFDRFQNFSKKFTEKNSRQAILAYRGDVYAGMQAKNFKEKDFLFAQDHLRIISGLYGLLRPLDRIQPYRLEMANRLGVAGNKDLYGYWKNKITKRLADELEEQKSQVLINLASKEYSSAVDFAAFPGKLIHCEFKEKKGDQLRIIGLFAKKARGQMASWIIRNRIDTPEPLKDFREGEYRFDKKLSRPDTFVFVR